MNATPGPAPGPDSTHPAPADDDSDALRPLIKEATQGEYEVLQELGRGGMAAVYLATDLALNRKVAIKTMLPELNSRPSMIQRFKREAQMAAGLSHPHIIQIHTVKETKRLVYFVMKFIEGRSLESIINDRGALDLESTRLILQQAASALSFAHHRGVIHRDVKPANIMIDENGWAVVTDFGIAKIDDAQNLTATGTAIGTPHYMSPEQFHNKPVTGASDQYALGVVAYEMLTGKKPFDGNTVAEIITQHLFKAPPDIRQDRADLPAEVADTLVRMFAKEPGERFPDLEAAIASFGPPAAAHIDMVRANLMAIARSGEQRKPRLSAPMSPIPFTRPSAQKTELTPVPQSSTPPAPPAPPLEGARRQRRAPWIAAAAILVLAVGGYFGWAQWRRSAESPERNASLARGVQLWQQGQSAAAYGEFTRAAQELPRSAMPHVYLARIAREAGNMNLARTEMNRALQLEPDNALALREMGSTLLAAGNLDLARRFFARALRANPADRTSMGWLACTLHRMTQPEQAARWAQRAGEGPWTACLR